MTSNQESDPTAEDDLTALVGLGEALMARVDLLSERIFNQGLACATVSFALSTFLITQFVGWDGMHKVAIGAGTATLVVLWLSWVYYAVTHRARAIRRIQLELLSNITNALRSQPDSPSSGSNGDLDSDLDIRLARFERELTIYVGGSQPWPLRNVRSQGRGML